MNALDVRKSRLLSAFPGRPYRRVVAYANRAGSGGEFEFVGRSALAGPGDNALVRAGHTAEPLRADVDPALVVAACEDNPSLRDRHPGPYASLT